LALDLLQLRLLLLQLHSELLLLFARGWRFPLIFLRNASTPGGSVSDPSTEIAGRKQSAPAVDPPQGKAPQKVGP
jgi:hypothetical protein